MVCRGLCLCGGHAQWTLCSMDLVQVGPHNGKRCPQRRSSCNVIHLGKCFSQFPQEGEVRAGGGGRGEPEVQDGAAQEEEAHDPAALVGLHRLVR